jgi:hypothetical protein
VCLIAIYEAHLTTFIGSDKFNQLILAKSYNNEPPEYQLNKSRAEPLPNFFEILKKNGTTKGVLKKNLDANFYKHVIILNQTVANSILERITVLLDILKNTKPPEQISNRLKSTFYIEMKESKYKSDLDQILATKKQQSASQTQAKVQDTSSDQEKDASSDQEKDILLQIEILVSDSIYIKIDQDTTDVPMPTLAEAKRITDKTTDEVVTDMLNKFNTNTNTIFKNAIMKLNNILSLSKPTTSAAEASEAYKLTAQVLITPEEYKLTAQVLITTNEVKLKINDFVKLDDEPPLTYQFVKYVSDKSINDAFNNLDYTIFGRFNKNTTSLSF